MDIDKIIDIVRTIKEEGPTVSLGSGKIAGTVESGDDPPVDLRSRNTKGWNIFFKDLVRRNRKKKK
jgi:uncharacterized ParB-like nuclease family protein